MTNQKTRAAKALESKKDKLRSRYCLNCQQMIVYDGTQGRKKFCNPACKMAYHRYFKQFDPKPAPRATLDRSAQQIINIAWAHLAELETALSGEDMKHVL